MPHSVSILNTVGVEAGPECHKGTMEGLDYYKLDLLAPSTVLCGIMWGAIISVYLGGGGVAENPTPPAR